MVSLATPSPRDEVLAAHVTNLSNLLLGVSGYDQTVKLIQKSDSTTYVNQFGNRDTTNGLAVQIQYGTSSSPTVLAQFSKASIFLNQGVAITQGDKTAPGTTKSMLYPRASDGRFSVRIGAAGTEDVLAYLSESGAGTITARGDMLYGSTVGVLAALTLGTTNHMLTVNGTTGPKWTASSVSIMSGVGDLLTSSAANTPARLQLGTANFMLAVNGTTGPAWTASPISVMSGVGDLLTTSAANTFLRIGLGSAGQVLTVNGTTGPAWTTNTVTHNQGTRAIGSTSSPITTSTTYSTIPNMSTTLTTTGGDLLVTLNGSFYGRTSSHVLSLALSLDGAAEVAAIDESCITADFPQNMSVTYLFSSVAATAHTVTGRWKTNAGTAVAYTTNRQLTMVEL